MTPDINKILKAAPVHSSRGAPMGAPSYLDTPEVPLYLQRVRMVDGDYTPAGVYFGGHPAKPLWCAFSVEGDNRVYVRGKTRQDAAKAVWEDFPEAKFWEPFGRIVRNPDTLTP